MLTAAAVDFVRSGDRTTIRVRMELQLSSKEAICSRILRTQNVVELIWTQRVPHEGDPALRWHSDNPRYYVVIRKHCFVEMLTLAKRHAPIEVGTSLIGRYADNGWQRNCRWVGSLGYGLKGSRNEFYRGVKGLRQILSQAV